MSNFSASSYADAIRLMKANPGQVFTWDAGDGWKSEGRYDPKLRRNVIVSINPREERV